MRTDFAEFSSFCEVAQGPEWRIVKAEVREEIIRRFEESFRSVGATSYDGAMQQFARILDRVQRYFEKLHSKEQLRASLDEMKMSWWEERVLRAAAGSLPKIVRLLITKAAEAAEDTLPPLPVGRPGPDFHTKLEVIKHVGMKHTRGFSMDQSKRSAALAFGISRATVQRIWDERRDIGEPDFRGVLKALLQEVDTAKELV